jgi:hypothetical protein
VSPVHGSAFGAAILFAALTVRSLIADMNHIAPSPIVFPHIADGGDYITQFILLGAGGASSTTIGYFDNNGAPLAVGR